MIFMTKQQYLSKLRKQLQFRLSNSEIADIISDIEECFDAGAAEGKSEEEICLSLGEPKSAAASLLNEQTGGERISKLTEIWLPFLISAGLFAVYTFCGFRVDMDRYDYVLPIMYVLPLIMWVLFERKGFFTALADYKCDFFTFFGNLFMIAAGVAFNEIPKRSIAIGYSNIMNGYSDLSKYAAIMTVFISVAMILLAVSLWKNAPKPFSAFPLIVIFFIIYNSVRLCSAYSDPTDPNSAVDIGMSFRNILNIFFICSLAFLIWSFINRNALTIASAYSAMTVTGFMFYWYYTLSALDPTDKNSIAVLENMCSGRNYIIWGTIVAAAVLVITIIVKLAGRKRGG